MSYSGLPWWLGWWRICLQCRRHGFDPWVGKIPLRREWLPTPVFVPREFHGHSRFRIVIYFICSSVYRDVQCREDKAPADYAQLVEVISGHFGVNPFEAWFNCVSWKLRVLNESWVLCWGWELMLRKSSIVLAIMEFTVQGTRQISKYSTMRWLQVNESSTYTME